MNKDITEDILLKAGFKETDRVDNTYTTFELTDYDITILHYRYNHCCYRQWYCKVSNNDGFNCAEADIQTIDHFNKLMELMDIDFRLKENSYE